MAIDRPYYEVKALMAGLGGSANYHAGGQGGGGTWELSLRGKTGHVRVQDDARNPLDELYVPKQGRDNPATWDDYTPDLIDGDDAFWKLVTLILEGQ